MTPIAPEAYDRELWSKEVVERIAKQHEDWSRAEWGSETNRKLSEKMLDVRAATRKGRWNAQGHYVRKVGNSPLTEKLGKQLLERQSGSSSGAAHSASDGQGTEAL